MRNEEVITFATLYTQVMGSLNIDDYKYELPEEKIALHPLSNRDESRLLVCKQGIIHHSRFYDLVSFLPENAYLFFNDTKVIPARLLFKKETGGAIEIFLLSPVEPSVILSETMQATGQSLWKCTIGNLKRWTAGTRLRKSIDAVHLEASLIDRENGLVRFTWGASKTFAEILNHSGDTPLPPYLKRKTEDADRERYQTIYSHHEGAVAAPTAGLHFTEKVFSDLKKKNIHHDFLTLHVSAGTFQPVKTENIDDHVMHAEQIVVTRKNIENLLQQDRVVIAVGTTSMRTLESLYWFGVKRLQDRNAVFKINQNDPYLLYTKLPSAEEAFTAIKKYMDENNKDTIIGETSIFIKPGYQFKVCRGLVTNFHQPASTLMLLVAAFIGPEWRKIYDEALKNQYRFLSYGDSSLLLP